MKPYFQERGITIWHGDCREVLPSLQEHDLLLTDPPYGIKAASKKSFGDGVKAHRSGFATGGHIAKRDYGDSDWDDAPVDRDLLAFAITKTSQQIIFGGNYFPLPPARCWLVWDKMRGETDYADAEMAWTNLDSTVRLFRFRWNGFLTDSQDERDARVHPTQKPIALMKWCIGRLRPSANSILDPWMGSGTTLVAAKDCGIPAVGIEISERYCEIAAKRLSQGVLEFS